MRVTIDAAGRIVVPKSLRDSLGLVSGTSLDIAPALDGLMLTPHQRPDAELVEDDGWLLIKATGREPTLDEVLELRDADRH